MAEIANTTNDGSRGSRATGVTGQGSRLHGTVLRLERCGVVFEVVSSEVALRTSEALDEFQITLDGQTAYSGRAVIREALDTGAAMVYHAGLDAAGFDGQLLTQPGYMADTRGLFADFLKQWQPTCLVSPELKIALADFEDFTMDLRRWMERLELGLRPSARLLPDEMDRQLVDSVAPEAVPIIDHYFDIFEGVALSARGADEAAHRDYLQRHLRPLLLCSPFAYRTFAKPLGYAGDYEMVNMMLRPPYEGNSAYAKLMNYWFLKQHPAAAHRNRIDYLVERLVQETVRVCPCGRPARVLNVACGPAVEMQRFVAEQAVSNAAEFTLLDFNEETLTYTEAMLERIKNAQGRRVPLKTVKKSVQQLLKEASRSSARKGEDLYDYVYCAGLFDYLTDPVCVRLVQLMYDLLLPGGLLVVTNVETSNPRRKVMEHILEWYLVYRTAAQLRALSPQNAPNEAVMVRSEDLGVNIMLEVRKPDHA